MYPHSWPTLRLVSILAAVALRSVALGKSGAVSETWDFRKLTGAGGLGLTGLLYTSTLRQTATDQQGIEDFLRGAVNYALTNYPLSAQQLEKANRPLVQLPVAFAPLGVMYNLPGVRFGELRLDSACLNGIYNCSIRSWNDQRIVNLNPLIAKRLPQRAIIPYAEDDSESATRLFKQYIWESGAWSSECVKRNQIFYKASTMASDIKQNNYTIGFTPYSSAILVMNGSKNWPDNIGMAAIKTADGRFIAPTIGMAFPFRAKALPESITSRDWALVNVTASGNPGAYPMGGLVYSITEAELGLLGTNGTRSIAATMQQFLLGWLDPVFQASIVEYGGVPLPQSQVVSETKQIEKLNTGPPNSAQEDKSVPLIKSPAVIIGAVAGSVMVAVVLLGGIALCYLRYRWRMQKLQVTRNIEAWRGELTKEGLLLHHGDIQYECVPGNKAKHVVLGEGTFGKVYKAKWNGTPVAVKVLNNNTDGQRTAFVRESNMLKKLRHPNVVQYLGCAITDHNEMMLVLEFMGGGDLSKAMAAEREGPRRFSWDVNGRFILMTIARGIAYIHSQGVVIFDVKPANVLLDEACIEAKITDVGLAKFMAGSNTETLLRGTAVYMAPELFPSKGSGSGSGICKVPVTQAVDIYSFGVLMWEVLTGERASNSSRSLRRVRVPEECPPSMDALWKRCISKIPKQRPTADEIAEEIFAEIKPMAKK